MQHTHSQIYKAVRGQTRAVMDALSLGGAAIPSWTLLLASDWAKSNRKLFREMVATLKAPTAIHCKCIMHMVALSIAAAAVRLQVVGPVFCGSILIHSGSTQERLASLVERIVYEPGGLEVLVDPILSDRERARIDRLLDLLHWDESMLSGGGLSRTSERKHRLQEQLNELKKFLCGRRSFAHVCPFQCCKNSLESKQRLVSILHQIFVFRAPTTPALNRWTQLYPALAFWCVCAHLPNKFMARIWGMAFSSCRGAGGQTQLDLLAPAETGVMSGVNAVRAGKVLRWLSHFRTPSELLVICLAMRPVMNFMGYLFREEGADSEHSVTQLMEPNSPNRRVVDFLVDMLARLDDDFWLVYAPDGWDSFHLQLAMDTFLTIAGGIWWRVGCHLQAFPWRLWHVVNPDSSEDRRCARTKINSTSLAHA